MTARSVLVASAAAALLFAGAPARADEKAGGDQVRCAGINACKGQGSCAGAHNACAGKNACKGQGIVKSSAGECKDKGGTVVEEKK